MGDFNYWFGIEEEHLLCSEATGQLVEGAPERLLSAARAEESVRPLRRIVEDGTSAHLQLRIHDIARAAGAGTEEAMRAVVEWLASATVGRDCAGAPLETTCRTRYPA